MSTAHVVGGGADTASVRRLVLRGGLWSAASQLFPAVGTAVLSVVAARALGSNALGRQSLIAYVNAAAAAVVVGSLTSASLRHLGLLHGAGDSTAELTRWTLRAHVAAGALVCALMAATGAAVGRDHVAWAVVGSVSLIDAAAMGIGLRVVVKDGWAPYARLSLIFQMVGPPLGIVGVLVGLGITGIFVGDGLAALGLLVALTCLYGPRTRWSRALAAAVPADGARLSPRGRWRLGGLGAPGFGRTWRQFALVELITQVVAKRVEFVVLIAVATSQDVAMYSVAFTFVVLIALVPSMVASAALPVIAAAEGGGSLESATAHVRLAIRLGTLICVPLVALAAVVGPTTVLIVYGAEYVDAARLVPVAALALLASVGGGVCGKYWAGRGRLGVLLAVGAGAGLVDVVVAVVLAARYGALGAVVANLAGQAVFAGGLIIVTVRRTGALGWYRRGLVTMTTSSVYGGLLAAATISVVNGGLVQDTGIVRSAAALSAGGTVGVVATVLMAMLLKVLDAEEASWLAPLLPRRLWGLLAAVTAGPGPRPRPVAVRAAM